LKRQKQEVCIDESEMKNGEKVSAHESIQNKAIMSLKLNAGK